MKKVILTAVSISAILWSCKKKEETQIAQNVAPAVTIAIDDRNYARTNANVGESFSYFALATDADGSISKVIFYANDVPYDTVSTAAASTNKFYNKKYYTGKAAGDVKIYAKAFDNAGAITKSNEISLTFTQIKQEVMVAQQVVVVKQVVAVTK